MKRMIHIFLFFAICCASCNNKSNPGKAESDLDAARQFIHAALEGNFSDARNYMLADSANENYLEVAERNYNRASDSIKSGYRDASIRIYSPVKQVNDSVTIIIYANSFKNDPDTLKVIKIGGDWKVDLKYLYEHDMDTTFKQPPQPLN